jgi:glycosyltransferase involved in cell wall biosynthesis
MLEFERVDGVGIVRRGSELTTRFHALGFARSGRYDVVLEQVNTLPYLAPLWASAPTVLFVHQLARDVWWYEAPFWAASPGYVAEPMYLQAYRSTPVLTVSESTRNDLRGLGLKGPVEVIPMAVDTPAVDSVGSRTRDGRLLALGRLTPSKRFDHAIRALAKVREAHPRSTLTIAGEGRERSRLERLAAEIGLVDAVELRGTVSAAEKTVLLTEADVVVGCSVREGWGMTVTEAARRGTPAVAYDIHGFRDSITDGTTGLLTPPAPDALAAGVRRVLEDAELHDRLRHEAWRRSLALNWEATTSACEVVLERVVSPRTRRRG